MKRVIFAIIFIAMAVFLFMGMTIYYENSFLVGISSSEWAEGPTETGPGRISYSGVQYIGDDAFPSADGTYDDWYVQRGNVGTYLIRSPHTISGGIVALDYTNDNVFPTASPKSPYGRTISYFGFDPVGKHWLLMIVSHSGSAVDTPFYVGFLQLND